MGCSIHALASTRFAPLPVSYIVAGFFFFLTNRISAGLHCRVLRNPPEASRINRAGSGGRK